MTVAVGGLTKVIAWVTLYSHPPAVVNVTLIEPPATITVEVVVAAEVTLPVEVVVVPSDTNSQVNVSDVTPPPKVKVTKSFSQNAKLPVLDVIDGVRESSTSI